MLKLRQAKWLSQCSSPRRHWSRFWCRFRGNEYEFNTDQSVKLPRQGQQQNTIPVTIVDYSPMKMHWIYPVYHSTFVPFVTKVDRPRQCPASKTISYFAPLLEQCCLPMSHTQQEVVQRGFVGCCILCCSTGAAASFWSCSIRMCHRLLHM